MKNVVRLLTSIPDVTPEMLDAEFWWSRLPDPDRPFLNANAIDQFNEQVYQKLNMPQVLELPDTVSGAEVRERLTAYKKSTRPRYNGHGELYTDADYERLMDNAVPDLPAQVRVQFGLITQRTSVRALPTNAIASGVPVEVEYDYFQETAVDIGWPVAILAFSRDEQWCYCLTPHYWGWVERGTIAFADRAAVEQFAYPSAWVTVLSSRGLVGTETGGITPQMGTRLPLVEDTSEFYRVAVPLRGANEQAQVVEGSVRKASAISEFTRGNLSLTARNLVEQAFVALGERYAWGDSRLGIFGRDCSRLVKDSYATTGVIIPRNADEQEAVCRPVVSFSDDMPDSARKAAVVECAIPGDMLFMPGHVMMYLGHLDGEPYVIHAKGTPHEAIIVSTLMLNRDTPKGALLSKLTSVGRVW